MKMALYLCHAQRLAMTPGSLGENGRGVRANWSQSSWEYLQPSILSPAETSLDLEHVSNASIDTIHTIHTPNIA